MDTNYDAIAADYKRAKQQPWRYFVERYTLLQLIGDLKGLSVLDLACGEGYSPEGQVAFGADYWEPLLAYPPITFLECVR